MVPLAIVGGAGVHWSQCSLINTLKQHNAMEDALVTDQLREIKEELRLIDLSMEPLRDEGRSDRYGFHKELKAGSKVLQWIPLGLVYMMAPHTKHEIKKPGIKQSENHVVSGTVDCNPVKAVQVVDGTCAECKK